jgi:hypothetical protein
MHRELLGLAEAVHDAPVNEPETDSIEWKSAWNLDEAKYRFETARHILGFGNRTVAAARRSFEGCSYLLAGVEPGNLVGVERLDPAKIDDAIRKYVAPGEPRWAPTYVTLEGRDVLIITVESPRDGDRIFKLQQGFGGALSGRIYARRNGQTEEANPAEHAALEERLLGGRPTVNLSLVRCEPDAVLTVFHPAEGATDRWVAREREQLMAPLAAKPKPARTTADMFSMSVLQQSDYLGRDRRNKEQFATEVNGYLANASRRFDALLLKKLIEDGAARLRIAVANPTPRNFEQVQVELTLPDGVDAYLSAEEAWDVLGAPDRPTVGAR